MTKAYNLTELKDRRRDLRKKSTKQEHKLWWYLRGNRMGFKFRRQHSVEGYILDFYCPEKKLIIEIDGEIHNKKENQLNDRLRDKFFNELGCKILRFSNIDVDNNIKTVLKKIKDNI
jgi:very-short-patch-repair endonuclease